ncbi:hypothetical protein DB354_12945 [Opitutus sp. ER46]|nr:hypothetical protein DB354_12945 [Opitutus sp. ER46]
MAGAARRRIAAATDLPVGAILVSATHTHSGPVTVDMVSNVADPVVPPADPAYLAWLGDRIVECGVRAVRSAQPAELGLAVARVDGTGGNRHDPWGPADPEVPVLVARAQDTHRPLACMIVHAMHPTVLHEDSTLISGDFPYFARRFLQNQLLGAGCPVVYHQGAGGNQSPRHVTRGNTLAEAERIGERLGQRVAEAIGRMVFATDLGVRVQGTTVELQPRALPPIEAADRALAAARARFAHLKQTGAPASMVRTAECDVFGAEETAVLARSAANGRLTAVQASRSPAEIQVISIDGYTWVGWPGEFFVEYALALRAAAPRTFVITLANGELQGYTVTPEAAQRGCYEASNALFAPQNGQRFVVATLALLAER